jgi:hypothetical protein
MVRHGTPWGLSGSLSDVWINPLPRLHRPGDEMRTIVRVLVTTALVFSGSRCAKTDWIDRTLVTVDVSGNWSVVDGFGRGSSFDLEQQGSMVKGFIGGVESATSTFSISGPITGTVAGDVFRFATARGDVIGELTVSGEEMSGTMSRAGGGAGQGGARPISLRRVDPSSPPASPPR